MQATVFGFEHGKNGTQPFSVNVLIGLTHKSVNASSARTEPFALKKKGGKISFAKRGRSLFPDRVLAGKFCVLGGA